MTARRGVYGSLAIGLYVAAAAMTALSGSVLLRPLYDGLAPPAPYRYVKPPPDLAESNERPLTGDGNLEVGPKGSLARTVVTGDGQALVVFPDAAFPPRAGESGIKVRIVPLDPSPLPPAPAGIRIWGNAYRVTAVYERSKRAVALRHAATAVLRYPLHGTTLLRVEGRRWVKLRTQSAQASFQLFAQTSELGTFATAGKPPASRTWIAFVAAGGAILAGAVGYLSGRRRRRSRSRRGRRRRRR